MITTSSRSTNTTRTVERLAAPLSGRAVILVCVVAIAIMLALVVLSTLRL